MKTWRFEVFNRSGFVDVQGSGVFEDIKELGIDSVEAVQFARVYLVEGDFDNDFANRLGKELLADSVCEEFYIGRSAAPAGLSKATIIEVHLKSGVTDPVAESVTAAIADMGVNVEHVRTARKYILLGNISDKQRDLISKRILANDCIEDVIYGSDAEPPSPHLEPYKFNLRHIPITTLDDEGLVKLSKDNDLFLDVIEMRTIQKHFQTLNREPTDIELESIAQTWSEHCVHKTLKSSVDMTITATKFILIIC